jgi:hypothetical protein
MAVAGAKAATRGRDAKKGRIQGPIWRSHLSELSILATFTFLVKFTIYHAQGSTLT